MDCSSGHDETIKINRTLARQVLRDGTGLLIRDRNTTATFVDDAHTSSVLCVPLIMTGKSLGVLYLDTNEPNVHFDSDHLQLASAIAAITAVAIENARHIEWLESENKTTDYRRRYRAQHGRREPPMRQVYQFIRQGCAY